MTAQGDGAGPRTPALVRLPLLAAGWWLVVWLVVQLLGPRVVELGWRVATLAVVVAAALLVMGWALRRHRRRGAVAGAEVVVVGTAVLLAGAATWSLHGTAWGITGLWADAAFRTETVTRYADSWRLADYAYDGLPAYYPPALSWSQGRLAALLDVPGWSVMKPTQVLLAGLVPLLTYALWRRVVTPTTAALVVAATSLLTVDLQKPDEWLVLMCAVPWWMDVVRGVRAPGVGRWPWWGHGLVAGAVLLTHTYYVLPLAVATLLGWAVDLARRRRPELGVVRALGVVVVGLLVATPYWVPVLAARLAGAPTDNLQLRYSYPRANVPPWPLPIDVPGALGLIGLAWLVWSAREARRGRPAPLAGALAVVLLGAYTTMLAGAVGVRYDVALLTFKSDEVIVLGMAAAGVAGLVAAADGLAARGTRPGGDRKASRALRVTALGLVVAVPLHYAAYWVVGLPATSPQTTRYPDGSEPEGRGGRPDVAAPAFVAPGGPSVDEVGAAWTRLTGRPLDSSTVLVTTRVDLLATTPVHPFLTWKSIYSNPLGRFEPRLRLLRRVARCPDPACAHRLLTENPYDAVDGLVLERDGGDLVMPVLVDDYPDRSRTTAVVVPARLLRDPGFAVTTVDGVAVVAVLSPR